MTHSRIAVRRRGSQANVRLAGLATLTPNPIWLTTWLAVVVSGVVRATKQTTTRSRTSSSGVDRRLRWPNRSTDHPTTPALIGICQTETWLLSREKTPAASAVIHRVVTA